MYQIILYNNGKRLKSFGIFKTYSESIKEYNTLIGNNKVYFPKTISWNGLKTDYELALLAPPENKGIEFIKDEFGGNMRIKTNGNFVIKQIQKFEIEQIFRNKITGNKTTFKDVIKTFLKHPSNTFVITIINNKMIVERFENDTIDLYILPTNELALSLCDQIKTFSFTNGLTNFIYFTDPNYDTKVRLYDILEANYGIERRYLQKSNTGNV